MLSNAKLQRMVVERQIEPEKAAAIIMKRRARRVSASNAGPMARVFMLAGIFVASLLGFRRYD